MTKVIDIKGLQGSGLLGDNYTEVDLCDAFLMYCISNNTSNKDRVVLNDGNRVLDIDSYFKMGSYSFYQGSNS